MKILIENNLYLESDEWQFILKEYTNSVDKRSGDHKAKVIGYYTSINGVINKLVKMKLRDSNIEHLHELKEEVIRIRVWAQKLLEEVTE
jgi:hypothetical protein